MGRVSGRGTFDSAAPAVELLVTDSTELTFALLAFSSVVLELPSTLVLSAACGLSRSEWGIESKRYEEFWAQPIFESIGTPMERSIVRIAETASATTVTEC